MNIGIDKISFFVPHTYLEMSELAKNRGVAYDKYRVGLGQEQMAVPNLYEDAVTLAANAVNQMIDDEDRKAIDMILVGSESGVDNSKSIGVYLQSLCKLSNNIRAVELKQACYGATIALQLAKSHIAANPKSKVLVIASDIAKYGLNTPGESTQGAGAVAMLISSKPRIAVIENTSSYLTEDIMDFWRPIYSDTAFADGKFSTEKYIYFSQTVLTDYLQKTNDTLDSFKAICFHQPFTKLGRKALHNIFEHYQPEEFVQNMLLDSYEYSRVYNKRVGNIYTGSLYLSLISLLEQHPKLKASDKIGMFSYGSGAVGEFFALRLVRGFKKQLRTALHGQLLNNRSSISFNQYEQILSSSLPKDGSKRSFDVLEKDKVYLRKIENHVRYYA